MGIEIEFKKCGNLLVKKDGTVWITEKIPFPVFFKYNKNGESSGYLFARLNERDIAVHRLMGKTWVKNPCPTIFDRIDHISRVKTDNSYQNLRWVNAHLNAINRENTRCTQFDREKQMWKTCIMCKGKLIFCGYFKTFCEGHCASMLRKKQLYNEIYTNLINGTIFP